MINWIGHSEIGAGTSGREAYYPDTDNGVLGYVCRLFNHDEWLVMKGNITRGLPIFPSYIVSKHETLEGAKAALLVMLAL